MTSSRRKRMESVLNNGQIVMTMDGQDGFTGRLYKNSESRGYQTNFEVKHFFYIVTFKNGVPTYIEGVSKDSRRKNMLEHMKAQGITHTIINQESFNQWIGVTQ